MDKDEDAPCLHPQHEIDIKVEDIDIKEEQFDHDETSLDSQSTVELEYFNDEKLESGDAWSKAAGNNQHSLPLGKITLDGFSSAEKDIPLTGGKIPTVPPDGQEQGRARELGRKEKASGRRKKHQCSDCDFETTRRQDLQRHLMCHSAGLKCSECNYQTAWKSNLKKHLRTHCKERWFKCKNCEYRTNLKKCLIMHMSAKCDPKSLKCSECDYETDWQGFLTKHVACRHPEVKVFACPNCDFACRRKRDLTRHIVLHTAEFSGFECPQCHFKARWKIELKRHLRTHPKVKMRKCPVSECSFSTNAQRALHTHHLQQHTKKSAFECPKCDYTTDMYNCLQAHFINHSLTQIFKCSVCNKYKTNRPEFLENHKLMHSVSNNYIVQYYPITPITNNRVTAECIRA